MEDEFREFLDTEIKAIQDAMKLCKKQNQQQQQSIIDWVNNNAARFREEWNKSHNRNELSAGIEPTNSQ
jgi:hypothetical protein